MDFIVQEFKEKYTQFSQQQLQHEDNIFMFRCPEHLEAVVRDMIEQMDVGDSMEQDGFISSEDNGVYQFDPLINARKLIKRSHPKQFGWVVVEIEPVVVPAVSTNKCEHCQCSPKDREGFSFRVEFRLRS